MVIGYIDRLKDISEEELINHLMNINKKKNSRSRCLSNIQRFKKKYFFTFWSKVLDKIHPAVISGLLVKLLGIDELQTIYSRIAFQQARIQLNMK